MIKIIFFIFQSEDVKEQEEKEKSKRLELEDDPELKQYVIHGTEDEWSSALAKNKDSQIVSLKG